MIRLRKLIQKIAGAHMNITDIEKNIINQIGIGFSDIEGYDLTRKNLPIYLVRNTQAWCATLMAHQYLVINFKFDIDVNNIKKQIRLIDDKIDSPIILSMQHSNTSLIKLLISEKISFIGKNQLYLPLESLMIKKDKNTPPPPKDNGRYTPVEQLVFLYLLYQTPDDILKPIRIADIIDTLEISRISAYRAIHKLQCQGAINIVAYGKRTEKYRIPSTIDYYNIGKPYLIIPTKQAYFVEDTLDNRNTVFEIDAIISGFQALSKVSMLDYDYNSYAITNVAWEKLIKEHKIINFSEDSKLILNPFAIEVWAYDGKNIAQHYHCKFGSTVSVDPISLSLSLRNEKDPRVEKELDNYMRNVWEKLIHEQH
jgi:hypothetical protein